MTRYVATLAYEGTNYCGFQRQPEHIPTVQLAVEQAIAKVTRQDVAIIGAGRTDTGVHAVGQVIAFDVEWKHSPQTLLLAINSHLPPDIALQAIRRDDQIHPRYDALWRQYVYRVMYVNVRKPLLNQRVWQVMQPLDFEAMQQAATQLIGEHDFGTFGTPPQEGSTNTIREVFMSKWECVPSDDGDMFVYRIRATAFLYHMVRRIVGTLVQVGRGRLSQDAFMDVFASCDIQQAKHLAPPHGLVFEAVAYPQQSTATSVTTDTSGLSLESPLEEK
jgi:tRNA pseudouridine38-40 synthase